MTIIIREVQYPIRVATIAATKKTRQEEPAGGSVINNTRALLICSEFILF